MMRIRRGKEKVIQTRSEDFEGRREENEAKVHISNTLISLRLKQRTGGDSVRGEETSGEGRITSPSSRSPTSRSTAASARGRDETSAGAGGT
jgi:hypothetical protein